MSSLLHFSLAARSWNLSVEQNLKALKFRSVFRTHPPLLLHFCWQPTYPPSSPSLPFSHVFADGPLLGFICLCCVTFLLMAQFWGISVRAVSRFCWRPCFGVYLSVLRHIFADSPVLGYTCPCCITFLLTAQFWGSKSPKVLLGTSADFIIILQNINYYPNRHSSRICVT